MKTFTDTRERRWEIDVTVGTIRRVKNLTDVDLTDALKGTLFQRLAGDVESSGLTSILCHRS